MILVECLIFLNNLIFLFLKNLYYLNIIKPEIILKIYFYFVEDIDLFEIKFLLFLQ